MSSNETESWKNKDRQKEMFFYTMHNQALEFATRQLPSRLAGLDQLIEIV